jgi:predicted GIY-YIG superfamily endonuclease
MTRRSVSTHRAEGAAPTLRSIGGFSILELFRVPRGLLYTVIALRFAWRHRLVTGVLGLYVVLSVMTGSPVRGLVAFLACLLIVAAGVAGWVRWGTQRPLRAILTDMSRRKAVKTLWPAACEAAGLTAKATGAPMPKGKEIESVNGGMRWHAFPGSIGATASAVQKKGEELAAVLKAERVAVRRLSPHHVVITAYWEKLFADTVTLSSVAPSPNPKRLSFGMTEHGPATVRKDTSILLGGVSGAGKSGVIAALIAGMVRDGEHYRLRVIDPAGGVELDYLNPESGARRYQPGVSGTHEYVKSARGAAEVIANMRHALDARLQQQTERAYTPDLGPRDILIIDELLLLDLAKQKAAGDNLREILAVGRKAGFVIWACTQDATVETVGPWRRLFRQRIALATENPTMTNVILGDNAEATGARCSQLGPEDAGIGWLYQEESRGYAQFRAAWITDRETRYIGRGELPPDLGAEPTDLYYAWKADGSLYYIGISNDTERRMNEHERDEPDWNENVAVWEVVQTYPNRAEALAAEAAAIKQYRPERNIMHNREPRTLREVWRRS